MSNNQLTSKVALVTGAARRIGAEIVRILHDAGMNIVLHYNASEEEAIEFCAQLNQIRQNSAVTMRADLQDADAQKSLITRAAKIWNRLDVLVNNASRFYRTPINSITDFAWDDLIISNLKGPFFLSCAAAPILAEHQGCIINITDINTERPLKDYSIYCISKSGLSMMTKVLARELAPNVRVNAVAPGAIIWPEGDNALTEESKQKVVNAIPLLRSGVPEDIAKAVLYFVRDADYVTGQTICVDGGRLLTGA